MDDTQPFAQSPPFSEATPKAETAEESTNHQQLLLDCEREIQSLERSIRAQKESSINAKTAITFEQLKTIYHIAKILGPQKEAFYDRICRAADIQRASLKNRLKQNKGRIEPLSHSPCQDTPTFELTTINPLTFPSTDSINFLDLHHPTPLLIEEEHRIPAERILDLMQLGFPFEEIKQMCELFDQCKLALKSQNTNLSTLLSQFSNVLSAGCPDHLKLLANAFNMLEMGYPRREISKALSKERRLELEEMERPTKMPRLSPKEEEDSDSPEGQSQPLLSTPVLATPNGSQNSP